MIPKRAERQCLCSGCDKPIIPGSWMVKVGDDLYHELSGCASKLQEEAPIIVAAGKFRAGATIKHEGKNLLIVRTGKKQGKKVAYCREFEAC